MAEIRPLQQSDLPAVSALLGANLPAWAAAEHVPSFLHATLIDDPWSDPELPSLVSVDEKGEPIGFIGAQSRRFSFGDRSLRAVCASHLAVAPEKRGGAVGALLLRRLLTAGQDFTYSDTANDEMARMCVTFGGQLDQTRTCDWMIVLRPLRWLGSLSGAVLRRREVGPEVPVGALPFKALMPGGRRRSFPLPQPDVRGERAAAAQIAEKLPEIAAGIELRTDYDAGFLEHLFAQMQPLFGAVEHRLVRRGDRAIGWYAYVSQAGAAIRLLHLLAHAREGEPVLAELVSHARERGAAVIGGRMEPHLVATLQPWMPVLGFSRRPWVHAHDPKIPATLFSSRS